MDRSHRPAAPWYALLAPIPAEVIPKRQPVASPEILASPYGAAIAGWEQLTVELSADAAGLRHVLVVLDATGQPISISDTVLYRSEIRTSSEAAGPSSSAEYQFYQESIGGRIEKDGSFKGTCAADHPGDFNKEHSDSGSSRIRSGMGKSHSSAHCKGCSAFLLVDVQPDFYFLSTGDSHIAFCRSNDNRLAR
jgi:hypothetical protein